MTLIFRFKSMLSPTTTGTAENGSEEQADVEADHQDNAEYYEIAHLSRRREDPIIEEKECESEAQYYLHFNMKPENPIAMS
ncbi:hypothetical protein TARUN_9938 [Trichoderma arundinaceum]|uniref:Uncharacterized protein n=1 Tax=Trichoderma arundinaceum TaxID=490622 RepID=A0A395N953_TRIAR|nr:hypothetical protein TARUN_9938 [Trichoderma arundinaceum]